MNLHTTQKSAQCLYALKLVHAHGLNTISLQDVCNATLVANLTYCINAWLGFTNAVNRQKLQAVLNRAARRGFCNLNCLSFNEIAEKRGTKLFSSIISNPAHVLLHLLPPVKEQPYGLRPRAHNRVLPDKSFALLAKNFLNRMLYETIT